jgi:hypothetical protein
MDAVECGYRVEAEAQGGDEAVGPGQAAHGLQHRDCREKTLGLPRFRVQGSGFRVQGSGFRVQAAHGLQHRDCRQKTLRLPRLRVRV